MHQLLLLVTFEKLFIAIEPSNFIYDQRRKYELNFIDISLSFASLTRKFVKMNITNIVCP